MKLTRTHDHFLPSGVLGLAVTPDGSRVFASCADGAIYDVDAASGKAVPFAEKHASFASGCVLLPDGKSLISGGYDGMLLWHDVETRRCWRRVQAHQFWNWQLALSPDGQRLVTTTGQYFRADGNTNRRQKVKRPSKFSTLRAAIWWPRFSTRRPCSVAPSARTGTTSPPRT